MPSISTENRSAIYINEQRNNGRLKFSVLRLNDSTTCSNIVVNRSNELKPFCFAKNKYKKRKKTPLVYKDLPNHLPKRIVKIS